jgi:AraC-like DNA-binding protein
MDPLRIDRLIEESLRFDHVDGAVTPLLGPHTTGWREMPETLFTQATAVGVEISRGEGEHCAVPARHGVLVPAGIRHRFDKRGYNLVHSRWAHLRITVLQTIDLFALHEAPPLLAPAIADRLGDLCQEMAVVVGPIDPARIDALLARRLLGLRFVEALLPHCPPRPEAGRILLAAGRLAPALQAMRDEYGGRLGVPRLAALCGLSPSRLQAVFRDALGAAPMRYLQRLRLDRARSLLLSSDLPVAEIAACCGFPDPFNFSRLFKQRSGSSPLHYRASIRPGLGPDH